MIFWVWLFAVAATLGVFFFNLARRVVLSRVRKLIQRDCIFEMEEDIRSFAAKSLPLYEKGLSSKEKALEVQHDVNSVMHHFPRLSTKTLRFILRSFRDQPKAMTDTINSVVPVWFFKERDECLNINVGVRNAIAFKNVRLGGNSECFNMLNKLRAADEVFNHEIIDQLSDKDQAWAERILNFLTYSRDTKSPVPVAIVEFLRDDPESLNHMLDYSEERGIRINEIDIPTLKEYLNAEILPLRDGML